MAPCLGLTSGRLRVDGTKMLLFRLVKPPLTHDYTTQNIAQTGGLLVLTPYPCPFIGACGRGKL